MKEVKVLKSFTSSLCGSREKGETFGYEVSKDEAGLLKNGLVEVVEVKAKDEKKA